MAAACFLRNQLVGLPRQPRAYVRLMIVVVMDKEFTDAKALVTEHHNMMFRLDVDIIWQAFDNRNECQK